MDDSGKIKRENQHIEEQGAAVRERSGRSWSAFSKLSIGFSLGYLRHIVV